jgi:MerR family redox-sensitive transcriptional activator SoxR
VPVWNSVTATIPASGRSITGCVSGTGTVTGAGVDVVFMHPRLEVQVNLKSSIMTIGEVAKRSGVNTSALRFYEDKGLISAERTESGHRRYLRAVLRRIAFIVFAQRVGLSLDEVAAEIARLPENRVPDAADWSRLADTWRARIDARIAELQRLRDGLTGCIGCGCLSLEHCALSNPGDRLARRGPGPAAWGGFPPRTP